MKKPVQTDLKRQQLIGGGAGGRGAFTLIELLVVISIIGILAALIIPLSGVATTKMRTARVNAELNNLVTAIETYKLETGQYPPDHADLRLLSASDPRYKTNAGLNPLFYELTGAVFVNPPPNYTDPRFITVENEEIHPEDLEVVFKRKGIRNSAREKAEIPYKGFTLKDAQYEQLSPDIAEHIEILAVPVPGPFNLEGLKNKKINPWFYDASSTNRHNKNGFDLWAEIKVGKETQIIGNWKN